MRKMQQLYDENTDHISLQQDGVIDIKHKVSKVSNHESLSQQTGWSHSRPLNTKTVKITSIHVEWCIQATSNQSNGLIKRLGCLGESPVGLASLALLPC